MDTPGPISRDQWEAVGGPPVTIDYQPLAPIPIRRNGHSHHEPGPVPSPGPDPIQSGLSGLGLRSVVKVWEMPEPPPRDWAVEGIIPTGAVTSLFGDGGRGKSYLALHLCSLICMGRPFAGRGVQQGTALYLDGELTADEFGRRAFKVARGLGLMHPPHGMHYFQLPGSLSTPAVQAEVSLLAQDCGASFIVLDSLTMASFGADANEAQDMVRLIKFLETLGTVVAIDHTPKLTAGSNQSHLSQFGSAFKRYASRSQLQLVVGDAGGLTLLHKKSNFGPLAEPIHLGLEFTVDAVYIDTLEVGDERLAGASDNLPAVEQVYCELAQYEDGSTPLFLSKELGKSEKTVKNHLTALKQAGRVMPLGDGRWVVTPNPNPHGPDYIASGPGLHTK